MHCDQVNLFSRIQEIQICKSLHVIQCISRLEVTSQVMKIGLQQRLIFPHNKSLEESENRRSISQYHESYIQQIYC